MKAEMKKSVDRDTLMAKMTFDQGDLNLKRTPFGILVELKGCITSGEPGGPGLPSQIVRLALPPFSRPTLVSAKAYRTVLLTEKPEMVAPMQLPQPLSGPKPTVPQKISIDDLHIKPSSLRPKDDVFEEPYSAPPFQPPRSELYEIEIDKPRPLARLVATEAAGEVCVVVVEVSPVRFTQKGWLEFVSDLEVMITYEQTKGAQLQDREKDEPDVVGSDKFKVAPFHRTIHSRAQAERLVQLARAKVINPEYVRDFSTEFPVSEAQVDYLIITDSQTWDEKSISPVAPAGNLVQAFQRLADWKARRGLKSRVVTISDIVSGEYGDFKSDSLDLQEVIRKFLKWAYSAWGISWVLLGGDVGIIPVRHVAGAAMGYVDVQLSNPPPDNKSYWTGRFLMMNVYGGSEWSGWPGNKACNLLVRADNGLFIPYDAIGSSGPIELGWHFCTDNTYLTRTPTATQFIRVNGPESDINSRMKWLYPMIMIPTDLYYASLQGPNYGLPNLHDWDLLKNGIYGQHTANADFDGVEYETDVSLGRAPVAVEAEANAFVDKVIAYEQFRRQDGSSLDSDWPAKMLLVAKNLIVRDGLRIPYTESMPPEGDRYHNPDAASYALIKLKYFPSDPFTRLFAYLNANDIRAIPFNRLASNTCRGWYYAHSSTDLTPSESALKINGTGFFTPVPTQWIAVYGPAAELTPQHFICESSNPDKSIIDQELLREQIDSDLPGITGISRLYEDEVDLSPAQATAAPVEHLTEDRLRNALNAAPHLVSLRGHGSAGGCCHLSRNMAQTLINGYHTFIAYAVSCLTNQFDDEDAVSERLLQNPEGGALAYIGYTRFSFYGIGGAFQRAFFHRLTSTRHLGLLSDSRMEVVTSSRDSDKWSMFSLNLMGDPEMPVWVGKPQTMKVDVSTKVDKRLPFVIQVTSPSEIGGYVGLNQATVHICQGGFSRLEFTDVSGQASFRLDPASLGELSITVTKIDYQPYIGKVRITGPAWVQGQVQKIIHQASSPNRYLIRLLPDPALDKVLHRIWYVHDSHPHYGIIMGAITNAYISGKKISLFVNDIEWGGSVEGFAFGYPENKNPKTVSKLETHIPSIEPEVNNS